MLAQLRALSLGVQLLAGAAAFVSLGGAYWAWRHHVYESGYEDAVQDMAARNGAAAKDVREAVSKPRACRDAGGRWDVANGLCGQE